MSSNGLDSAFLTESISLNTKGDYKSNKRGDLLKGFVGAAFG